MGVTLLGTNLAEPFYQAKPFCWSETFCPSLYPKSVTPIYNYVYIIYDYSGQNRSTGQNRSAQVSTPRV